MTNPDTTPPRGAIDATVADGLACTLPADQLARRGAETAQLFARARASRALDDGAELQFPGDDATARSLLDFVLVERRCCAGLTYELIFAPDHSAVRLRLRGSDEQATAARVWAAAGE